MTRRKRKPVKDEDKPVRLPRSHANRFTYTPEDLAGLQFEPALPEPPKDEGK